jgi:hypothetical protein
MFTESEVKSLNIQFHKWHKSKPAKTTCPTDPFNYLDQDPGITIEQMLELPKNPKLKSEVLKRRAERMRRLDNRMREVGVLPQPIYVDEDEEIDA